MLTSEASKLWHFRAAARLCHNSDSVEDTSSCVASKAHKVPLQDPDTSGVEETFISNLAITAGLGGYSCICQSRRRIKCLRSAFILM